MHASELSPEQQAEVRAIARAEAEAVINELTAGLWPASGAGPKGLEFYLDGVRLPPLDVSDGPISSQDGVIRTKAAPKPDTQTPE